MIAVMMPISFAVPTLPLRFLPTEDRPRIVLHGDQRLYRAEARIDNMAMAPVLHQAIRMLIILVFVSAAVLAVGSQAKKAKQAKRV